MENVENHMVVEARQKFLMEQEAELMEIDDPDTDAQREYLLDEIDKTGAVEDFLEATGLWSIRDIVSFFEDASLDDLQSLKDGLEEYDKSVELHEQIREGGPQKVINRSKKEGGRP